MTSPQFIIGVFSQPTGAFGKWRDRGVNTLVSHEPEGGKVTKAHWEEEAIRQGWSFMDYPSSDPATLAAEAAQPGRLAWMQLDEPDLPSHVDRAGYTREELRAVYAVCKHVAPSMSVFMNLAGSAFDNVWYDGVRKPQKTDGSKYGHRAVDPAGLPVDGYMAWADWLAHDYHLWTKGKPRAYFITDRLQDRVEQWSGGKSQFVFVETNDCGSGAPFTPDDLEQQVWRKVAAAAAGGQHLRAIIYWSHVTVPHWQSFDGTTPETAARMAVINARLANLFEATAGPFPPTDGAAPAPTPLPNAVSVTLDIAGVAYAGTLAGQQTANGTAARS